MDLLKDIQTALIIDDDADEIKELQEMLTKRGVYTRIFGPDDFVPDEPKTLKNHQLIFMDYMLIPGNEKANESKIRDILQKICHGDFGAYGLVLWTKHPAQIDLLKEKLTDDARAKAYITPLFVVGLDKTKYLRHGYASLKDDLNGELEKSKAAAFFFGWRQSVERGADKALMDMYALVPDYKKQEEQFPHILSQLAHLYSGASEKKEAMYQGMNLDACKAFNELLHYDATACQGEMVDVFDNPPIQISTDQDLAEVLMQKAKLNSKFLIDETKQNATLVLPGRVYHVKQTIEQLEVPSAPRDSKAIAVELTPPCDAQNKKYVAHRLIGGFMIDCPTKEEEISEKLAKLGMGSRSLVWPIYIEGTIKILCFDYRCVYTLKDAELGDESKFEMMFTAKNRLFAELLQKFTSHAARFGLAILQPYVRPMEEIKKDEEEKKKAQEVNNEKK